MDLNYTDLLSERVLKEKANRLCRFYALIIRMLDFRALIARYSFIKEADAWPMLRQSVAEHAFLVAQLAATFYSEFLEFLADKNISVEKLESEALHHDDAEALTGDAATDVDRVSRFIKDSAETNSISMLLQDLACRAYRLMRYESYEAKATYSAKIVKLLDAVELVFYTAYCVRNGAGMLSRGEKEGEFVISIFGEKRAVDERVYKEVSDYFQDANVREVSIAKIMADHSVPRLERLGCPELVSIFKLLCEQAFEFPFEKYNLTNMPMEFSRLAQ